MTLQYTHRRVVGLVIFSCVNATLEVAMSVGLSVGLSVTFLKYSLNHHLKGTLGYFKVRKGTSGYYRYLRVL